MTEFYSREGAIKFFVSGSAAAVLFYLALTFWFSVHPRIAAEAAVFASILALTGRFLFALWREQYPHTRTAYLMVVGSAMLIFIFVFDMYAQLTGTEIGNEPVPVLAGIAFVLGFIFFVAGFWIWVLAISASRTKALEGNSRALQESEKTRHEFIDMITHQLKTPLTPVKGYSEMLLNDDFGKLTPKQREAMGVIHGSVAQLDDLITKMLHISRLEAGKMSLAKASVSIGDVVKAVLAETQAFAGAKDITLLSEVPESLPKVSANKDAVISVLSNLVHNAIKFTPHTGKIAIEAKERAEDVLVAVRDNGVGISEERLAHTFDRFHAATPATDGTTIGAGLGLSICRSIINAHGGKIWAESELGVGSIFYFTLPKEVPKEGVMTEPKQ
ncbi:MAG: HAMP domain-containing sensor histidine kinase [Candidatus Diapherotrites archaeon]